VASTAANGSYGVGAVIPITVTFDKPVTVTGTPLLALNTGATGSYASGSGSTTLTFNYTVGVGQSTADLDYSSTTPINLNGGAINDALSGAVASLTLPAPGSAGSLGANKNIVIDATPPVVVDFRVMFGSKWYSLTGSTRYDLPWRITGIQVVFSEPIVTGNVQSLTGLSPIRFRGLGTNTLTWTIRPLTQGSFTAGLANTGAAALKDRAGNPVIAFSQAFKVLLGDVNDDHVVNAADEAAVRAAQAGPYQANPAYNPFADVSGDGIVNLVDVGITRTRKGTSIP
jgi:large repetitive protein